MTNKRVRIVYGDVVDLTIDDEGYGATKLRVK